MARKILLADDSVTAQNMGRKILADAGYEVITVNNGSAALKKITEAHPDLIVLDVYMPGYSGLEVCQRIKEGTETSRIPVLLTVGKLEPFKQEEARRARADAFIVKPFEATELLAAVGKLQDKLGVVPSAAPAKETRFATATMSSFEKAMQETGPKFGDQDSGWKSRLTIPVGGAKHEESEVEPGPASQVTQVRNTAEEASAPPVEKPAPTVMERPIPAGIPQDITPDEIAALTAAAARVNVGLNVGKDFERMKKDVPGTTAAERTNKSGAADETAKASATAEPVVSAATVERATAGVIPTPSSETVVTTSAPAAKIEQAVAVAVAAPEPVTIAAAPRWVAEEVPLEAEESMLVLEREMHKAFAAFAAAEYAALPAEQRGAVDKTDEPLFATMAPPAIGTPVPAAEEAKASIDEEPQAEPVKEEVTAKPPLVAKPPAAPFAPAATLKVDEEDHAVAAFGGPDPFGKPQPEKPAETQPEPVAAATAAQPGTATTETPSGAEKVASPEPPAWKDIRGESAKSDAGKAPEKTAPEHELVREAAMAAAASADGSASSPDLSSIVDNMLAELKPKLMAELAKKLDKK